MRTLLIAIFLALAVPGWAPAIVDVPAADCCCAESICDSHTSTKCACPLPASVSAQAPAVLASASTFSAPPAADADFFSKSAFAPTRSDRPLSPPPKFTA